MSKTHPSASVHTETPNAGRVLVKGYCTGCGALRSPSSFASAAGDTWDSRGCVWSVAQRCLSPGWSREPRPAAASHHVCNCTSDEREKTRNIGVTECVDEDSSVMKWRGVGTSILTSSFCLLSGCGELGPCCSSRSPPAARTASCWSTSASCSWARSLQRDLCFLGPQIHCGGGMRWGTGSLPHLLQNWLTLHLRGGRTREWSWVPNG